MGRFVGLSRSARSGRPRRRPDDARCADLVSLPRAQDRIDRITRMLPSPPSRGEPPPTNSACQSSRSARHLNPRTRGRLATSPPSSRTPEPGPDGLVCGRAGERAVGSLAAGEGPDGRSGPRPGCRASKAVHRLRCWGDRSLRGRAPLWSRPAAAAAAASGARPAQKRCHRRFDAPPRALRDVSSSHQVTVLCLCSWRCCRRHVDGSAASSRLYSPEARERVLEASSPLQPTSACAEVVETSAGCPRRARPSPLGDPARRVLPTRSGPPQAERSGGVAARDVGLGAARERARGAAAVGRRR